MSPIINPWFFYIISKLDSLADATRMVSILALSTATMLGFLYIILILDNDEENVQAKRFMNLIPLKKIFIIGVLSLSINFIIPSEITVYKMIISQQATPNNISSAIDFAKSTKDELKKDLIEIINKTKSK